MPSNQEVDRDLVEDLDRLAAHEVGQLARVEVVLVRHVGERLLAAAHRLELGDADARAVELADDVPERARRFVSE